MDTETLVACTECGHLHFDGRDYVRCPLAGEGCVCFDDFATLELTLEDQD